MMVSDALFKTLLIGLYPSIRGSGLLSHFYTWHAESLHALVFVSVGYVEPSDVAFDLG